MLTDIVNNIGIIAGACGGLVTIAGFITLISNKGKSLISKSVQSQIEPLIEEIKNISKEINERKDEDKKLKDSVENVQQATNKEITNIKEMLAEVTLTLSTEQQSTLAALRHSITSIYQKYLPKKALPQRVREDLMSLYDAYHKLGGNSYIHQIYEEMLDWEVE